MTSFSSISWYELVPPPAPKTVARPATLGACQVRLQLSMLLLPITTRANFCAMKFISLVLLEQLKRPKLRGPRFSTADLDRGPYDRVPHSNLPDAEFHDVLRRGPL